LQRCRELGVGAVAVLGHPGFYPRFGFTASSRWNIVSEYDVQEEVFMLMELIPGYLQGHEGVIQYNPAFAGE
jgi:predicted N-acetyltransferase YhbS